MAKIKKIEKYSVTCDHCSACIETEKTEGKVQCWKCGKRTEI